MPGNVVVPRYGKVDFSRPDLPLKMVQDLYESDFPYLQITPEGLRELYGIAPEKDQTETQEIPQEIVDETEANEEKPVEIKNSAKKKKK